MWYNGLYTTMAKPIKTLELRYPMIQGFFNSLYPWVNRFSSLTTCKRVKYFIREGAIFLLIASSRRNQIGSGSILFGLRRECADRLYLTFTFTSLHLSPGAKLAHRASPHIARNYFLVGRNTTA